MAVERGGGTGAGRELAREVARRSLGQFEASLGRILGESGANGRWLLGALVLLNGGGIAMVASLHAVLAAQAAEEGISLFVIGAALAVLAALLGAASALFLARMIGEASAHWTQVAESGDVSDAALKAAARVRRTGLITALSAQGLGLFSLILFVAGAMTLASGLARVEPVAAEEAAQAVPEGANIVAPAVTPTPVETPTATPSPIPTAAPPIVRPAPRNTPGAQRRAPARQTPASPQPVPVQPAPALQQSAPAEATPPPAN